MGHMAAMKLPCAKRRELEPQDAWQHPSRDSGAGATGHVVAPEMPRATRRELAPQEVWRHPSCP
jgi:hypothetical protein